MKRKNIFARFVAALLIVVLLLSGLLLPSKTFAKNGSRFKSQGVNSLWHDVPYDIFIQQAFSNTNGVTQDFYYHSFSVPLNSATVGRFFIVSYTPDVSGSEFYASVLSGAGAAGIFSSPGSPIYSNSMQAYCFLDSAAFGWNGWAYIGDTAMLNYCDTVAAEMNWTGSISKYWNTYGSGTTAPILASLGGFSSQTYRYVSWYNGGSGQIWSLPIFYGEPPVYATSTPTVTPTSLYTPLPTFTFTPTSAIDCYPTRASPLSPAVSPCFTSLTPISTTTTLQLPTMAIGARTCGDMIQSIALGSFSLPRVEVCTTEVTLSDFTLFDIPFSANFLIIPLLLALLSLVFKL